MVIPAIIIDADMIDILYSRTSGVRLSKETKVPWSWLNPIYMPNMMESTLWEGSWPSLVFYLIPTISCCSYANSWK